MASKIFLIAYRNIQILKLNLQYLKMMSDRDIVIIDMGIDKEIRAWVSTQNEFESICAEYTEYLEHYAQILNTAIREFSTDEDIMILNANRICLGDCIRQLEEISNSDPRIGAVVPAYFNAIYPQVTDLSTALRMDKERRAERRNRSGTYSVMGISQQCVFLTRRFIDSIGDMDERFLLPDTVMLDYSFRGLCQKWKLISAEDAFVYETFMQPDFYASVLGSNADRDALKEKWGMNYFNVTPNGVLIKAIDRKEDEEFAVLEVGCDCGANLAEIGNLFPKSRLFGLEINPGAAAVASGFGEVQTGNIEDYNLAYERQSFDYIIFGDVLEHLRDPERAVAYCRCFLKPQGKVIASVPNLMHYTVLKALIGGNFTYQDAGLLDRTHIHFFTLNEIVKMFARAGYQIDTYSFTKVRNMSEEDRRFVEKLKDIGGCETFTYIAFQYLVTAGMTAGTENDLQPKFRSDEETIRQIVEEKKSLGRFGDGEFAIAFDIPRQKFQKPDPKLRDRIRQVITQTDNPSLLIGIANNYGSLERYNARAAEGIKMYMTEKTKMQHMSLLASDRVYSDAYISRPYVLYKDAFTDAPGKRFHSLKKIWENKRIIMVEGAQTRLGVGNDLFDNAKRIRRILAPATDSFDRYDDILSKCIECRNMADLFLLAIGPSSGVLAYDLSKQGMQAVDVGHIDMEYEWYLAGTGGRVSVPHKYNNEVLGGDNVCDTGLSKEYYEEIIADYSGQINLLCQ